ncbi:MAG: SDR family oxidoreductase [Proteobacteria bacterium]|nr:SDR family oxidoreductase [Pseudomonadota bacterium]
MPDNPMPGKLLLIGATGMLGRALGAEAGRRGYGVTSLARSAAGITLDITDAAALESAIAREKPDLIINSAALVDLALCEADPEGANAVNAQAVGVMARQAAAIGAGFVQISSDHYFTGDGDALHDEEAKVTLVNAYGRSKFAGEGAALGNPDALVLRTNVTGFRGRAGQPTFIEWAIAALGAKESITAFSDYYTSTIDAATFAGIMFDLVGAGASGLLNVASRQTCSKEAFIRALARRMGIAEPQISPGSVEGLQPPRAESLGLDVSRAETIVTYEFPTLDEVVDSLVSEHERRQ